MQSGALLPDSSPALWSTLRVIGSTLRVVGSTLRVIGSTLRVIGSTLRVVGSALRVIGIALRVKELRRWLWRKMDQPDVLLDMEQWKSRSLITSREVANKLGISMSTVQEWTHDGRLPYVRVGSLRRYKIEDVFRFIEQNYVSVKKDEQPALPFGDASFE